MKTERWIFCESELANPAACTGYDEFVTTVSDPDNGLETLELGVIVYRNGTISSRWEDGTVGLPPEVVELAEAEEEYYSPDLDEPADVWADVLVGDRDEWLGWAGTPPRGAT